MANNTKVIDVTIGTTTGGLSSAIDLHGMVPVAIQIPAAWTSGATDLTFQGEIDGGTYCNMYVTSGELTVPNVAVSHHLVLAPDEWVGVNRLKVRSGTAGTPVAQGAERILKLIVREV